MKQIVLSLFPGIGILDRGFEEAGFCVVRGPDLLWGGDIRNFHVPRSGSFDGVIGGPPCQAFSLLSHMVRYNGYEVAENLIPEFERVIAEAQPYWFLMENVERAPSPTVAGYHVTTFLLNNRWLPNTTPQHRLRRFWFGCRDAVIDLMRYIELSPVEPAEFERAVIASGTIRPSGGKKRLNKNGASRESVRKALLLQGLPEDFFGSESPFTVGAMQRMIGNAVSMPMARAVANAVKLALAVLETGVSNDE